MPVTHRCCTTLPRKRSAPLLLALCLLILWASLGVSLAAGPGYSTTQILVALRPNSSGLTVTSLAQKMGLTVVRQKSSLGPAVLKLAKGEDPNTAVTTLKRISEVRYAELSYQRQALQFMAAPDDPGYNDFDYAVPDPGLATYFQWDLYTIYALEGWSVWPGVYYTSTTKPTTAVKVAVIDTGIDRSHPDFINAGGSSTNALLGGQIDIADSANLITGYAGPYTSFDDGYGHGTHVAGTIAAAANSGLSYDMDGGGIAGVGYNGQIMALKVLDEFGSGSNWDVANAINYAADRGARVINLSLGSSGYSQVEQDAINYAWSRGALVVAAAGNSGTDAYPSYPAACDRVLAVSATNLYDLLASYSSWGDYVGIAAPGGDTDAAPTYLGIWSTLPTYPVTLNNYGFNLYYDYLDGTSMAAPHVAGLATLYIGYQRAATGSYPTPLQVYQAIQRGADNVGGAADGGWESYFGYGRINVFTTMAGINPRDSSIGCITGQVLYRSSPTASALVSATSILTSDVYQTYSRTTSGCYRLENLPAGSYNLTVYYSGRTQTLSNVLVNAGCDTPGTDFSLNPLPDPGVIAGRVTDYYGGCPLKAYVWVRGTSPVPGTWAACGATDPSTGSYSISGLQPGTYSIQVSATWYRSQIRSGIAVTAGRTTWSNFGLRY